MFEEKKHIDIRIPRSWQQCSTQQLETIAYAIMEVQKQADGFRPFEWMDVKARVILPLAGLETIENQKPKELYTDIREASESYDDSKEADGNRVIVVRFTERYRREHKQDKAISSTKKFPLRIWQIHSMIRQNLEWLGEDNDGNETLPNIYNFPYPKFTRCLLDTGIKSDFIDLTSALIPKFLIRANTEKFKGCSSLMQDFTWERYRYAQDYMAAYIKESNRMIGLYRIRNRISADTIKPVADKMDDYCASFLACCFSSRVTTSDPVTGRKRKSFEWSASMVKCNSPFFCGMVDGIQWSVIMLWWTSIQHYLQQKYPKCFSSPTPSTDKKKKKSPTNPLELYVRGIATLSKYLGLTEEEVNQQNFQIILQHMNDMAEENERIERMSKK